MKFVEANKISIKSFFHVLPLLPSTTVTRNRLVEIKVKLSISKEEAI